MTLDEFWFSFLAYPSRLECYDAKNQKEYVITDRTEMDDFTFQNGSKMVKRFKVDFVEKSIWVELEKEWFLA